MVHCVDMLRFTRPYKERFVILRSFVPNLLESMYMHADNYFNKKFYCRNKR